MYKRFVVICVIAVLFGAITCFPEFRIVNGTATTIEKFPFMVSLRNSSGSHICGGSIIAPSWILTAAHCVNRKIASEMSIQYGSTEISPTGADVLNVKRFIMHEDFRPNDGDANDVALLELVDQLVYNYETIAPVTLPELDFEIPQEPEGALGILIGWGRLGSGGIRPNMLQEVNLKIYSDDECKKRDQGVTTVNQICAGVDEGGKGQCNGDSGGPLLYEGHIQLGIVSRSKKPCTVYPYLGMLTKVSHYVEWIKKHMD